MARTAEIQRDPGMAQAIGLTDMRGNASQRARGDDHSPLASPGVAIDFQAEAASRALVDAKRGITPSVSAIDATHTASAGVRASAGVMLGRNPARAPVLRIDVEAGVAAASQGAGAGNMQGLLLQGAAVYDQAQTTYATVQRTLIDVSASTDYAAVRDYARMLGRGENPSALQKIEVSAATDRLAGKVDNALVAVDGSVLELERLVGALGSGVVAARAEVVSRGAVREGLGLSTPALVWGDRVRHSVRAAARVDFVQPMPLPKAAARAAADVQGVVELRSSMVAVAAYVDVNVKGLSQLATLLRDVNGDLAAVRKTLPELSTQSAAAQGRSAAALLRRGNSLADSVDDVLDTLDIEAEARVDIRQATGPGVGLGYVAVEYGLEVRERNFAAAVELYMNNVAGYLPGRRDTLRVTESGDLSRTHTGRVNVWDAFYRRYGGVDIRIAAGAEKYRVQARVGVATDGASLSAHVGYTQALGRRFFVHAMGTLSAMPARREVAGTVGGGVGLNIGGRRRPDAASLSVSGSVALDGEGVIGGSATLGIRGRFGGRGERRAKRRS